jgi:outer membrane lipoprotein
MCMGKYLTAVLLWVVISGCASYPIAKNLRQQAQPLNFTQVTANPGTTRGALVVWGGRVINTVNGSNGTEIYVLELPLHRGEQPVDNNAASGGRFIAVNPGPVEPNTYPAGSLITVAGELNGVRNERLQNLIFPYPVLDVKQVHLWSGRQRDDHYFFYGAGAGWRRADNSVVADTRLGR